MQIKRKWMGYAVIPMMSSKVIMPLPGFPLECRFYIDLDLLNIYGTLRRVG